MLGTLKWKVLLFANVTRPSFFAAMAGVMTLACGSAAAGETRGFAVTGFMVTGYYYPKGEDCPSGFDVSGIGSFTRNKLAELGYSKSEIERHLSGNNGGGETELPDIITNRGRIHGKPVNVYRYPESVPDPNIKIGAGRHTHGFNLDGDITTGGFVDPDTGEKGVDNNFYRVVACWSAGIGASGERAIDPSQSITPYVKGGWDASVAHLIEVSNIDDYKNDDDVLVGYYVSLDYVAADATGEAAKNRTMRVDPNRRWKNLVRGKITNGVLTTAPFDLSLLGMPYLQTQEWRFKQARLRLKFSADGSVKGILSGYQYWLPLYVRRSMTGYIYEVIRGADLPGLYYALKRMADAYPDSKTGQNTMISASYRIETVPTIIVHASATTAANSP